MNTQPASLKVSVAGSRVFILISGRATFQCSVAFKTLVTEMWDRGSHEFIIDLRDCPTMDSTFLGVLSGLSQKMSEGKRLGTLSLVKPNQRILELLDNLGIGSLFPLVELVDSPPEDLKPVESAPASKKEFNQTMLDAHRTLTKIYAGNIPKFKDVIRYLEEDLKQLGG